MNILLLTPDAVGGTFLKSMLAIYMQLHKFDRPVVEVGHIELGLEKYYCPVFNQEILKCSHDGSDDGYQKMQSLSEIQNLLKSVDHYKIIKLPHYNLRARSDPLQEQVPFYHYLNKNYFVISCRRDNLFEHSLSWSLNKITKSLNVYSINDKFRNFANIYQNGVTIDPLSIKQSLDSYKRYINWTEKNFRISSYYSYEKDMPNIEKYILSLPVFGGQQKLTTWKETFGQDVNDWNRCHYYLSDIGSLKLTAQDEVDKFPQLVNDRDNIVSNTTKAWSDFLSAYDRVADPSWPAITSIEDWENLPNLIKNECIMHDITYHLESVYIYKNAIEKKYTNTNLKSSTSNIDILKNQIYNQHREFLNSHAEKYQIAATEIQRLEDLGIISTTVPIKKQTFKEKQAIVRNFSECLEFYNTWIMQNPELGSPLTEKDLYLRNLEEQTMWSPKLPTQLQLINQ
jgi:hypothetical protein